MEAVKYKIGVGWLAFGLMVLHFSFILIYALPHSLTSNLGAKAVATYIEPVFMQRWSLFAPCPKINSELAVRFYFEDDSTGWVNPVEAASASHAVYRGSYHGELVLASSNLVYWLRLDLKEMGVAIGEDFPIDKMPIFFKGYSYFKLKNYLSGNSRYLYKKSPLRAKLKVWMEDVETGEKGMLILPEFVF